MRRAARVDATQAEVVATFRGLGWGVLDLARLGGGVPDLVAVSPDGQRTLWCEVKAPGGKLRPAQVEWAARWPATVHVLRGRDEVLALVGVREEARVG